MASNYWGSEFTGNIPLILTKKIPLEALRQMVWGRWLKFTTPKGAFVKNSEEASPQNSPIIWHNELGRRAGDKVQVPMWQALDQLGKVGSEALQGAEEEVNLRFADVYVDVYRYALRRKDGSYGEQIHKDINIALAKNWKPALTQHYGQALDFLFASYSIYNKYSYNVLQSASNNQQTACSHPNLFIRGGGKVAGTPGTAAYEAAAGAMLDEMGVSDTMSVDLLESLDAQDCIQKIKQEESFSGMPMRVLLVNPYQLADLRADADSKGLWNAAFVQGMAKNNPLLTHCHAIIAGFAIYDANSRVFAVRKDSDGNIEYGPSSVSKFSDYNNQGSDDKFGAIVLGAGALRAASCNRMKFFHASDDYEARKGVAYETLTGMARSDYLDLDGGGGVPLNTSSAIVVTKAGARTV